MSDVSVTDWILTGTALIGVVPIVWEALKLKKKRKKRSGRAPCARRSTFDKTGSGHP
jgi:hypothetical protein